MVNWVAATNRNKREFLHACVSHVPGDIKKVFEKEKRAERRARRIPAECE
jgi:hypothetical protein